MQLSETDKQDILKHSQTSENINKSSFGIRLKEFLEKYQDDPIDIDTSIFDSYRKSVKERDFRWED